MAGNKVSFSFFFLLPLFCLQAFPPVVGDLALIKRTCKQSAKSDPKNLKYNFCVVAFQAVPGSLAADIQGLGIISAKLAMANATDTSSYINYQLSHNKTMDPATRNGMRDCSDLYSDAVSDLADAVKDFQSKSYNEANFRVSAAMDASTTCEDGFNKRVSSPMKDRDANLFQLCAISLAITHLLAP